jgi:uncharacterized RDD family membrane protein YckC
MAEWKPYGTIKPAAASVGAPPPLPGAGQVICGECGRSFPPDQVIRHGNTYVCASCKPVFLQKLKEGVVPTVALNYAGFWIRLGAFLIDLGIMIVVGIIVRYPFQGLSLMPPADLTQRWIVQSLSIFIGVAYYTFFVGKYGATPGKMATRLLIVNADGSKVGYGKAIGRYFAQNFVSGCLTLCIGDLMIAWDDEKRGLHDRICGTRVIRK